MIPREQKIVQLRAELERLARGGHAGSSTYFLVQLELKHLEDHEYAHESTRCNQP